MLLTMTEDQLRYGYMTEGRDNAAGIVDISLKKQVIHYEAINPEDAASLPI